MDILFTAKIEKVGILHTHKALYYVIGTSQY